MTLAAIVENLVDEKVAAKLGGAGPLWLPPAAFGLTPRQLPRLIDKGLQVTHLTKSPLISVPSFDELAGRHLVKPRDVVDGAANDAEDDDLADVPANVRAAFEPAGRQ